MATASKDDHHHKKGEEDNNNNKKLYPTVIVSHPDVNTPFLATSKSHPSMYPTVDTQEIAINLFPDDTSQAVQPTTEETLLTIPGTLLHLVDPDQSLDLGAGSLSILRLRQGDYDVTVLARLTPAPAHHSGGWRWILAATGQDKDKTTQAQEPVQWPLTRDVAAVKLDTTHYFFSLHVPHTEHPDELAEEEEGAADGAESEAEAVISYGLTFAGKGQEKLLEEFDKILETYTSFSVHKVVEAEGKGKGKEKDKAKSSAPKSEVLDTKEITPAEALGDKKEVVQEKSAAYWTTLAPNVDDYSSHVARLIASGSGLMIRGILWTGDVTADRLRWGEQMLKKRVGPANKPPKVKARLVRRMKRARMLTTMSDKVANSILSGVLKVSGFFTKSVFNSKPAQKFFKLMPGEAVLASLDGFGKVWDAIEVSGKNVMQTTSVVTTGVATHRYGDQAGELTHEYLHATGHALGAAWAVFKIRKALDPKAVVKPTNMLESAMHVAANESIARQKRK